MTDIYSKFDKAFSKTSAAVILFDGQMVAKVAHKHGSCVTAFVHWLGVEMVSGRAGGGGYDRATGACAAAANKLPLGLDAETGKAWDSQHKYNDFRRALVADNGTRWANALENAGFTVLGAI